MVGEQESWRFTTIFCNQKVAEQISIGDIYPLVNQHNHGKSPFLVAKSTINGHVQ